MARKIRTNMYLHHPLYILKFLKFVFLILVEIKQTPFSGGQRFFVDITLTLDQMLYFRPS